MDGTAYLSDVTKRFRETQFQFDNAIGQVPFELWGRRLDPESNSIVTLILHLSGNMRSRWTDFLIADGEKPDRNRDSEFEDPQTMSKEFLIERLSFGWGCLFNTLSNLSEADLDRRITIRSEPHSVIQAIHRQLTHAAYHAGQVVFLSKHLVGSQWHSLSVRRQGSDAFNKAIQA